MPIVQTVLGSIDPIHLGRTLTHEHVAQDFDGFCSPAPKEFKLFLEQNVCMENLGYVRQYPYSSVDNGRFYGEDCRRAILKDVALYKKFGGGTIVENSVHGVKRNLDFMVEVAESTGVHMIAGTGHYVHEFQEPATINMTVEQMGELYSKEITTGVKLQNEKMVKCGFIGEVGSGYPIHDFEKRAIQATGEIQETLGCGVSFHPGRNPQAPFEVMRLYLESGGKASKCVMSHLDRTIFDMDELLEFSKLGCYLQYDLFGLECSFYQFDMSTDMPSDAQRINNLMKLMEEGLANRILMSHDIYTKHRLTSYGGHGYHHIHMNVLPRMLAKGVTVEQIEQITIKNPANWLEFNI